MSDLTEALCEDLDAIDFDEEPAPVEDALHLDRRLAALARLRKRIAEFDAVAEAQTLALEAEIVHQRKPMAQRADWLERSLQMSMEALYERDHSRTSLTLTSGSLRSKDGGVAWVWPEPKTPEHRTLVEWVKDHLPDAFKQDPAPEATYAKDKAKALLKEYALDLTRKGPQRPAHEDGLVVFDGGEIVPGVTVQPKGREFLVEPTVQLEDQS